MRHRVGLPGPTAALCAALVWFGATGLGAQGSEARQRASQQVRDCRHLLDQAEAWHDAGRHERILEADLPGRCLAGRRLGKAQTVRAYRLLALARIETDDLGAAREAVRELLATDPDYAVGKGEDPVFAGVVKKLGCGHLLGEVQTWFDHGRFDKIVASDLLGRCLELRSWGLALRHRLRRPERIAAFKMLADAYLLLDDEDQARAMVTALLAIDPEFETGTADSPELRRLVAEEQPIRGEVASVSRTAESRWEAPATTAVITAEQIEQRGYLDLESALRDLPGFDVSRGNGLAYSNLYQRGFRSNTTDRILFLVDGVEQNDLHSNVAYLSRQYPLSHVQRLEVLYGPASTIYGANAYTGVIHVITKRPRELVPDREGGDRFAVRLDLVSGAYGTRAADFTVAGRQGKGVAWTLTGRQLVSDERDLSGLEPWDFAPTAAPPKVFEDQLRLTGDEAAGFDLELCRGLCRAGVDGGQPTIELTDAGAVEAARLDALAYSHRLGGAPIGFSDATDDSFVAARLDVHDLSVGFQFWRREEGAAPWYDDRFRPGKDNGSVWIPRNLSLYLDYGRSLGRSFQINAYARYLRHDLGRPSAIALLHSYENGSLGLADLVAPGGAAEPFWERQELDQISTQMRGEMRIGYTPTEDFDVAVGLEFRSSTVQGDFTRLTRERSDRPGVLEPAPFQEREKLEFTDLGLYLQGSYRTGRDLKFYFGGRFDNNNVREGAQSFNLVPFDRRDEAVVLPRESAEFGTVFNPRFAIVYTPGNYMAKAIYTEAFKDPSSFEKFTTDQDRILRNPGLEPERVRNVELAGGWRHPERDLTVEATAWEASYSSVVAAGEATLTLPGEVIEGFQFGNTGALTVRGLQASAAWQHELENRRSKILPASFQTWANYTFTEPETRSGLRIGDIARHRFNLGLDASWQSARMSLRLNHVGERKTGAGTTVSANPLNAIGAYTVLGGALSWRHVLAERDPDRRRAFASATLQLVVDNLLDESYFHPGVQAAGRNFVPALPQPGRSFYLRLTTELRARDK